MKYAAASHQGATCHVSCICTQFAFMFFFFNSGQFINFISSFCPNLLSTSDCSSKSE